MFAPTARGKGNVAQLMANALAVYELFGIRTITLTAGLTAGSAVWPRMGFAPTDAQEWLKLRVVIEANLAHLGSDVHASYERTYQRALRPAILATLADDDPQAIFELLDVDPENQVGKAVGLRNGIAGVLLAGGHWKGALWLQGAGGRRLRDYVAKHGVSGPTL